MTAFYSDLTLICLKGLKGSDDTIHKYAADLIEHLQAENLALSNDNEDYKRVNTNLIRQQLKYDENKVVQ